MGGAGVGTGMGSSRCKLFIMVYRCICWSHRVERYGQYNTMDLIPEVNAALDIPVEFLYTN